MDVCNNPITRDEFTALIRSDQVVERERAIAWLACLLTSGDKEARCCGYDLFRDGLQEALYRACLNYGSLAGSFTEPLVEIVRRAVECWASGASQQASRSATGGASRP
jgi:hypothetical protein